MNTTILNLLQITPISGKTTLIINSINLEIPGHSKNMRKIIVVLTILFTNSCPAEPRCILFVNPVHPDYQDLHSVLHSD